MMQSPRVKIAIKNRAAYARQSSASGTFCYEFAVVSAVGAVGRKSGSPHPRPLPEGEGARNPPSRWRPSYSLSHWKRARVRGSRVMGGDETKRHGRALEQPPFDGRLLGELFRLIRPPIPEFTVRGGMMVDRTDINHLLAPGKSFASFKHAVKLLARHASDRLRHPRCTRPSRARPPFPPTWSAMPRRCAAMGRAWCGSSMPISSIKTGSSAQGTCVSSYLFSSIA